MTIMNKMILLFVLLAGSFGTALAHMGIDTSEFQARRQSVMNQVADGIVLLHSFSGPKSWSDSGFRQDSNFYYLTGLENLHDAILAVDSGRDRQNPSRSGRNRKNGVAPSPWAPSRKASFPSSSHRSGDEIIQACIRYVEKHKDGLHSDLAKRAALELLKPAKWVMYTHGIDMVEIYPVKELRIGNTVAFGPDFDVDGQGFYQEDVSLITADGHQLINPPLPYSVADIEKMMAQLKRSQK